MLCHLPWCFASRFAKAVTLVDQASPVRGTQVELSNSCDKDQGSQHWPSPVTSVQVFADCWWHRAWLSWIPPFLLLVWWSSKDNEKFVYIFSSLFCSWWFCIEASASSTKVQVKSLSLLVYKSECLDGGFCWGDVSSTGNEEYCVLMSLC